MVCENLGSAKNFVSIPIDGTKVLVNKFFHFAQKSLRSSGIAPALCKSQENREAVVRVLHGSDTFRYAILDSFRDFLVSFRIQYLRDFEHSFRVIGLIKGIFENICEPLNYLFVFWIDEGIRAYNKISYRSDKSRQIDVLDSLKPIKQFYNLLRIFESPKMNPRKGKKSIRPSFLILKFPDF